MTRKNLVAEIATKLKKYDDAGLVDYISINEWIRNGLKEFGGNIMDASEFVVNIKNGKGDLPDNFYSLVLALKCDLEGYYTPKEPKKLLQSSNYYVERIDTPLYWDNQLSTVPCPEEADCHLVKQDVYFLDRTGTKTYGQAYYGNVQKLKLKKGYNKTKCDKGCPNLFYESPYEVSINNTQLQPNFEEGNIYIRYRGLPVDETGDLIIPEIQRNKLQEYLQYTCIRRTLEDLLLSSDDPNVANKYQLYKQLESEAYEQARKDAFNEGLLNWKDAIKKANKRDRFKYEMMYSSI